MCQEMGVCVSSAMDKAFQALLAHLDNNSRDSSQQDTSQIIWPANYIPPWLKTRILKGEYIDFDDLLPEVLGQSSDNPILLTSTANRTVEVSSSLSSSSPKRQIHDSATLMEA